MYVSVDLMIFQPGSDSGSNCSWLAPILQGSLRHVYQRFILESDSDVLELAYKVDYK